jgi:hypothetical protein
MQSTNQNTSPKLEGLSSKLPYIHCANLTRLMFHSIKKCFQFFISLCLSVHSVYYRVESVIQASLQSLKSLSSNEHYDNLTRQMFHSIKKYFLYLLLLCLIVYSVVQASLQSLTWCDLISYTVVTCIILHILFMPLILLSCYYLQDNRYQNIIGISCITMIIYIMIVIFMVMLSTTAFNDTVVVQQGNKAYQCIDVYGLAPQATLYAYPVIFDRENLHAHRVCFSRGGKESIICSYEQALQEPPNHSKYGLHSSEFLTTFVCRQNDPEGVDLCHRYGSVSLTKFLSSLICNYMSDQSGLTNGKGVGVVSISCPWKWVWITVPEEYVAYHERIFTIY